MSEKHADKPGIWLLNEVAYAAFAGELPSQDVIDEANARLAPRTKARVAYDQRFKVNDEVELSISGVWVRHIVTYVDAEKITLREKTDRNPEEHTYNLGINIRLRHDPERVERALRVLDILDGLKGRSYSILHATAMLAKEDDGKSDLYRYAFGMLLKVLEDRG